MPSFTKFSTLAPALGLAKIPLWVKLPDMVSSPKAEFERKPFVAVPRAEMVSILAELNSFVPPTLRASVAPLATVILAAVQLAGLLL